MDMQDQPRYEAYEPSDRVILADGQSSRPLVEGTVPRQAPGQPYVDSQTDYFYTGKGGGVMQSSAGQQQGVGAQALTTGGPNTGGAGAATPGNAGGASTTSTSAAQGGPDVFPVPVTAELLTRGQDRFNNFCSACHGLTGQGDGMIVRRGFQKPPSFHDDRLQEGQASAAHFFDVITNGFGAMYSYNESIPPKDRWAIIAYIRALQLSRRGSVADVPDAERGRFTGGAGQGQQGGTQTQGARPGGDDH
ncbi:MAG TPA: cytochrome c [Pyrinomonadaceae bacterium]|nr:cytochrome c [Pyrinomonadaceae bacterium]